MLTIKSKVYDISNCIANGKAHKYHYLRQNIDFLIFHQTDFPMSDELEELILLTIFIKHFENLLNISISWVLAF